MMGLLISNDMAIKIQKAYDKPFHKMATNADLGRLDARLDITKPACHRCGGHMYLRDIALESGYGQGVYECEPCGENDPRIGVVE